MKRSLVILFLLFSFYSVNAQTYKVLADSALSVMQDANDAVEEKRAFNLYEQAFKLYPKQAEDLGWYKASVLAARLLDKDKAFLYLEKLVKNPHRGSVGWKRVLGRYSKSEFKNILNDQRWTNIIITANAKELEFLKQLEKDQAEFQSPVLKKISFTNKEDGKAIYQKIKNFNSFSKKKWDTYSIKFKVTDSLNTSYFVSLPKNYNPNKRYVLLFFLHGAVQGNSFADYQDESVLGYWNRYYTKYSALHEVIIVYPMGSKKYNWMGPDDGFFMVPAILKEIKQSVNIDDDKVFITGHSNGATGSFSYLMKQQSPFAGFYGSNTQPKVRTGGTFIKNILNRSYFNISTDLDYYYPPAANDSLNVLMKKMGADYADHRYNGFPHGFPAYPESELAYPLLFSDLDARQRKPFNGQVYWECDDVKYGKADWLQITQLDTASKTADWHQRTNFTINKLLVYNKNNDLVVKDTTLKAFNFPRKSAAVKGYFKNNEFHLETSAVKSLTVFISPEMVDMTKPVMIYINGIKKTEKKPVYNKQLMIGNFKESYDRKAIWVDQVEVII